MKRLPRSHEEKSLAEVWDWYQSVWSVLRRDRARLLDVIDAPQMPEEFRPFVGFTREDAQRRYEELRGELDLVTSMGLFAALEAAIRVDFQARVEQRRKDSLSRAYRKLWRLAQGRKRKYVRLEEDILEAMKASRPGWRSQVGQLKGALAYRHWLAHGRYWLASLGSRTTRRPSTA